MGLYLGDKQSVIYKGDAKPVNLYLGAQKVAGWKIDEQTGTDMEWEDAYNDWVDVVALGRSKQTVTVQGKNLYSVVAHTFGYYATSEVIPNHSVTLTVNREASGSYVLTNFISVKAGVTYVRSYKFDAMGTGRGHDCLWFRGDGEVVSTRAVFTPSEDMDVRLGYYAMNYGAIGDQIRYYDIQIEIGTTATPYEPFTPDSPSPDYPSPIISTGEVSGIGLTVTGNAGQAFTAHREIILRSLPNGTKDTYDAVTGQITRRMGKEVLDGTEVWTKYIANTKSNVYFSDRFIGCALEFQSSICTHFKNANRSWDGGPGNYGLYSDHESMANRKYFHVGAFFPTIDDFKAYLAAQHAAGTPVTVLYKLAAPIIEQIDPEALPSYYPYTRVLVEGDYPPDVIARAKVPDIYRE